MHSTCHLAPTQRSRVAGYIRYVADLASLNSLANLDERHCNNPYGLPTKSLLPYLNTQRHCHEGVRLRPIKRQFRNNMSITPVNQTTQAQLRQKAESSLIDGMAPATQGWTIGTASLTLLHKLASDPETAGDALKMLHELQVHQVELDFQHEHLQEEHLAAEQSTLRLVELYLFAPVAYFMVGSTGQIIEGNLLGAQLMGVSRDEVQSHNITRLVDPDSRAEVLALLDQVSHGGERRSCRVQALDTTTHRTLDLTAGASACGQHCLVVVVNSAESPPALLSLSSTLADAA